MATATATRKKAGKAKQTTVDETTVRKELKELIPDITGLTGKIATLQSQALTHAEECGSHLARAKELVRSLRSEGKGRWAKWVEANCGMTKRNANQYIQIWTHWKKIEPKLDERTIRGALKAIRELKGKASGKPKPRTRTVTANDMKKIARNYGIDQNQLTVIASELFQAAGWKFAVE